MTEKAPKAAKRSVRSKTGGAPLADRLIVLFGFELGVLERVVAPLLTRRVEGSSAEADTADDLATARDETAGAKGRIEAISQMTRTLEKLLELKQLETLALGGDGESPDAEADRLAAELMRRLRVLDRRRRVDAAAAPAPSDAVGA